VFLITLSFTIPDTVFLGFATGLKAGSFSALKFSQCKIWAFEIFEDSNQPEAVNRCDQYLREASVKSSSFSNMAARQ